jgi:lambda family phage portal protein
VNLLDRAIAPLFPGWALQRMQARMAIDLAGRAYEAAKVTRGTRSWRTSTDSARLEVETGLATLRARSRDLVRNNPWGIKLRRQLPAHMVGTGVSPRPSDGADTTRRRALRAWDEFSAEADHETGGGFGLLQNLAAGTVVESGEVLLWWEPDSRAVGGWRVRVMEPDYLDETFSEISRNGGNEIVSGVEFDGNGRRVAYHLFREHPGDVGFLRSRRSRDRIRIPAAQIDHVFEPLRPGQVRGVPWMAASALRLRDLDDYLEAERWRKKIAAAFAAFVRTPQPAALSPLGQQSSETATDGSRTGIERIAPGTIKRLAPGEEVSFPTAPTDNGVSDYLRWELFAIAAGCGVPYAELTGDLSNANYSSMRVGKLEFWALLDQWQWNMLAPMMLRRAWQRVQAVSGVPGMPAEWSFPRRQLVDPLKEIEAEEREIRAGLRSQPDAIAARGDDWRAVLAEQAEYLAAAKAAGVAVTTDATLPAKASAPAAEPAPAA